LQFQICNTFWTSEPLIIFVYYFKIRRIKIFIVIWATITSPGKGEDAKSPPLSYRTRSGRLVKVKNPKGTSPSKIPVRANINAGDARSDPEYSSESENDQADEEEIDPAVRRIILYFQTVLIVIRRKIRNFNFQI
jgi:hypothetical protein